MLVEPRSSRECWHFCRAVCAFRPTSQTSLRSVHILGGDSGATKTEESQGRHRLFSEGRCREHAVEVRGHAGLYRHSLLVNELHGSIPVPPLEQERGKTDREGEQHPVEHATDMCKRHGDKDHVIPCALISDCHS